MSKRLSLCMIVKNEIDSLEQAIDSVIDLVDEVAIVDTGSTDGTWELVQTIAHRHVQIEWPDHFAEARNRALDLATGEWVLILDGDEVLGGGREAVQAAVADHDLVAAELRIQNDMGDGSVGDFWACRLFRRLPQVRWEGRIHEQVLSSVQALMETENRWKVARIDATIEHHGYLPEVFEKKGKAERNVRLLEQSLRELPEDASLSKRVYTRYKLATALGQGPVGQGHLLASAQLLLDASPEQQGQSPLAAEILVSASQTWTRSGACDAGRRAAIAAQALAPGHPMVALVLSQAHLSSGDVEAAIEQAERSRNNAGNTEGFYFDRAGHDVALTVVEATIDQRQGCNDDAVQRLASLRERHPDNAGANVSWIHALIGAGQAREGLSQAVEHLKKHPSDRNGLLACAEAAEALGMHDHARKWRSKALG